MGRRSFGLWLLAAFVVAGICVVGIRYSELRCIRIWRTNRELFTQCLTLDDSDALRRLGYLGIVKIKAGDSYTMFVCGNLIPDPVEAIVYCENGFAPVQVQEFSGESVELHEWRHLENGWYYCAYDYR